MGGPRTATGRAVPGTEAEHAMAMAYGAWLGELRDSGRHPDLRMDERWAAIGDAAREVWLGRARGRMAAEAGTPLGAPRILAVAVVHGGEVHAFPSPGRHHDAIRKVRQSPSGRVGGACPPRDQGFVLEDGTYVGRRAAAAVALAAGQAEATGRPGELFSEDLW